MMLATFGTKASTAGMYVQLYIANTANHCIQKDTNHNSDSAQKFHLHFINITLLHDHCLFTNQIR